MKNVVLALAFISAFFHAFPVFAQESLHEHKALEQSSEDIILQNIVGVGVGTSVSYLIWKALGILNPVENHRQSHPINEAVKSVFSKNTPLGFRATNGLFLALLGFNGISAAYSFWTGSDAIVKKISADSRNIKSLDVDEQKKLGIIPIQMPAIESEVSK